MSYFLCLTFIKFRVKNFGADALESDCISPQVCQQSTSCYLLNFLTQQYNSLLMLQIQ